MRKTLLPIVAALLSPLPVSATLINIDTDATQISQSSYTFGDYILELVAPANSQFNLIDGDLFGTEDFVVSNASSAGDFTLRRLDDLAFSLLGIRHAGQGTTTVGGVSIAEPGSLQFEDFSFSGQTGVTSVTSILFSPSSLGDPQGKGLIQLSAFDVISAAESFDPLQSLSISGAVTVPEPDTRGLMLSGLLLVLAGLGHRKLGRRPATRR